MSMLFVFMTFEVKLPSCLIFTLVTRIFYTFMDRFFMSPKSALLCELLVTPVTGILNTFMDRFFVLPKCHKNFELFVTLVTVIPNTLVDRFHMGLKTILPCSQIITLTTFICYTFMDRLMNLKMVLLGCLIPTVFTRIANIFMFTPGVMPQTPSTFITCLEILLQTYSSPVSSLLFSRMSSTFCCCD